MSAALHPDAASILAQHLARREADQRDAFLREMLAHSAAALQVIHGPRAAAEAVYSLADCMVCRDPAPPKPRCHVPPRDVVVRHAEHAAATFRVKLADVLSATTAKQAYRARRLAWRGIVDETGCSLRGLATVWGCDHKSIDRALRGSA